MKTSVQWLCMEADAAAEVQVELFSSLCAGLPWNCCSPFLVAGNNLFIPYRHGHGFSSAAV